MTPMDLFERQFEEEKEPKITFWGVIGMIIAVLCFFFLMWFAGAMQEHYDCLNGSRPEVCIPEDFE